MGRSSPSTAASGKRSWTDGGVIVDVHVHYIAPEVFESLRRRGASSGVRLLPGDGIRLQVGDEAPTRPLLPALHTLDLHTKFFAEQGIDAAVFGRGGPFAAAGARRGVES